MMRFFRGDVNGGNEKDVDERVDEMGDELGSDGLWSGGEHQLDMLAG
jgi:hypothetical protein